MSRSLPMPTQFSNKFEWAADFASKHGMTLPPDTPELRSLRNWFCYKLNQYKKGTLGDENILMLHRHGLDFSQYEATNTGKGHRTPDGEFIAAMQDWHERAGSYDLGHGAAQELVRFHKLHMDCFAARGYTERARKFEEALPGFHLPTWRRYGQAPITPAERQWWADASDYAGLTEDTPAFLGVVHPQAPLKAAQWAHQQIDSAEQLNSMQRGFMLGQGLLVNKGARERYKNREADLNIKKGVSLDDPVYGIKDRRLDSFLGVCMLHRMRSARSTDKEILAAFGIDPAGLTLLRANVYPLFDEVSMNTIQDLRKLFAGFGEWLLTFTTSESLDGRFGDCPAVLKPTHTKALAAIADALAFTRANYIRQDIAVY